MIRLARPSESNFLDADSSSELQDDSDAIVMLKHYLALTSSRLDRLVQIDVSDEGIELTGEVYSRGDRVLAESIARAVLPGHAIHNQIVFVRPSRLRQFMKNWR